jgi:lipopolysaccharide transport system permease protein
MVDVTYDSRDQGRVARLLPDLRRHRGLLIDLVSKELRARYRNAMIGFAWAVLHPLLLTLVLAFVFTVVFQAGGRGGVAHSALDILSKLVFWQFFSSALMRAATSIEDNRGLVGKVCFPRETVPLAAVLNCGVNLVIGLATFLVVHVFLRGMPPAGALLALPVAMVLIALACGLALLLAALSVFYQDVAYLLEVALTFGFYASPVLYPAEAVAGRLGPDSLWLKLYMLNPMTPLLTALRDALMEGRVADPLSLAWPALCALAALAGGAVLFRRWSPVFADHL